MYIIIKNTGKSEWHYGPFRSRLEANDWAQKNTLGVVKCVQLVHPSIGD